MSQSQAIVRTMRGIQQSLIAVPPPASSGMPLEAKGVVYTKRWVVELLLDLAGYCPEKNLVNTLAIEPAAGNGAFLGPIVERLVDSCRRLGKPILDCRDSLRAYELDDNRAAGARIIAVGILTDRGVDHTLAENLAEEWIRTGDYLFESYGNKADFVIGNPPYVRLEDIPVTTASLYRERYGTMRGRADLYVAFFEAALHQLKENGTCAFICADRWMRNQYGSELRGLITSMYAVEFVIEMHNADAFHDEVDAYPAITVIRRRKQGSTVVASIKSEIDQVSSLTVSERLLATAYEGKPVVPNGFRAALVDGWSKGTDPWPCNSPEQLTLLRRLEQNFPKLEPKSKVGIGVATGNDKVFITKNESLIERSRLLKLALAGDIGSGTMKWSGHYLVNPWDNNSLVNLRDFPLLCKYFDRHSEALKRRHTARNNLLGWYKTIDRVTHSLTDKSKLYIADIKGVLDPVLDRGETYPHHNLYFIQSDEWDLEVLGGILISAVGQFFVKSYGIRMRGGYLRFQAQYLRRIRVPDPGTLSQDQSQGLAEAFRRRDRQVATQISLDVYSISKNELERALAT